MKMIKRQESEASRKLGETISYATNNFFSYAKAQVQK